jgi:outer membrane murein-binding lipoprotein Lpp
VRLCLVALALCAGAVGSASLVGCGREATADPAADQVQQLLDRRAQAVLAHDEKAYLATGGAGEDPAAARRSATWFHNLTDVPLSSWAYRVTGFHHTGDTATADTELRYRIDGYDRSPVATSRTVRLHRRAGRWYVTADRPAGHSAQQLWEQGRVVAVRGSHSLVLGVGQSAARLKDFSRLAEHAVPAVQSAWGGGWPDRVVVQVPASLNGMAGLLGTPASGYRGIAAVTTGEVGGSRQAPADRIIINPDAYGVLGTFGRQVVLTHETTHVATRAYTSAATPMWLSEGYADWVGYRRTGRTAAQAAPELQQAVRQGGLPTALPDDADFGFSQQADPLAEAYEGGWLACRMIADDWGEARLKAFYQAVGAHTERAGAVEDALRKVLGTSQAEFTARWRRYLWDQLD